MECRDDVKVIWCHCNLVWLSFEVSIPTCTCFCIFCYNMNPSELLDTKVTEFSCCWHIIQCEIYCSIVSCQYSSLLGHGQLIRLLFYY